jgi:competence protein ComEA
MKKILFFMALSVSFLFSAMNLQTASKKDLMCINGIGAKKAEAILKYRKANKLKSADDLLKIKGFGKGVIANVKAGKKTVACGGKKPAKKINSKKVVRKDAKKKITPSVKTVEKKKTETKSEVNKTDSTK